MAEVQSRGRIRDIRSDKCHLVLHAKALCRLLKALHEFHAPSDAGKEYLHLLFSFCTSSSPMNSSMVAEVADEIPS